ncbi:hypothetical protein ACFWXK_14300 [Streptomyces sp. NPDC059070]|uniref:hypothetical protein n=1 Tax=Streptomyces sp. NPDC059070 TaxID=3346713 RepID=UPI0036C01D33
MRIQRFYDFATEALAKGPDIQAVDPWSRNAAHLMGWVITFSSGARIWVGLTTTAAPGDKDDQKEIPVTGDAPTEVPYPELYADGKITPTRAQAYLAAALTNSGSTEISRAYPYSDTNQHPGLGVIFHSEARASLLFHHTARPGQDKGSSAFSLQTEF